MTEVICLLTFGDKKKAGINSLSKEEVTQKDGHKQRTLNKYKRIQGIPDNRSNQALKQLSAFQIWGVVPITGNM